ncbi:hypothetical protein [Gemmatimonas aurantiaca]|uniref:hypothetical protein n=1 Tax=Gemmatimonas aurantiaca TaxID=173480 RepID=UPI00145E3B62|nr:hypothetical protein [Gemmatimonas aurantiaca]
MSVQEEEEISAFRQVEMGRTLERVSREMAGRPDALPACLPSVGAGARGTFLTFSISLSMVSTPPLAPSPAALRQRFVLKLVAALCLISMVLNAFILWRVWPEWHAGVPDFDPDQYRGIALGSLAGIALSLAIPIPMLVLQARPAKRGLRVVLWVSWLLLMVFCTWAFAVRLLR